MKYNTLLDMTTELGYRLAMCGAETFRVEESVNRSMAAYGLEAECFAIPNLLIVSLRTPEGETITRIKRIGFHGNDLDGVEQFSNLSRKICAETPDPEEGLRWLAEKEEIRPRYGLGMVLFGAFLGAAGYCLFFGGSPLDMLWAGLLGILVGILNHIMGKFHTNPFFSTIATSFLFSLPAYTIGALGLCEITDSIIIGTLMILVPGLLITNAMRDIIYGDTNSGINRIIQVLLIAVAIALGTAAAYHVVANNGANNLTASPISYNVAMQLLACFIGCAGFSILFNIHGNGGALCVLGGVLTWAVYCLSIALGSGDLTAYFFASLVASFYSEVMARVRKYPAISYLVVSIFPLLPGAGIYYTMLSAVESDLASFASKGTHTAAIAGCMALGILLASTLVRLCSSHHLKINAK